MSPIDVALSAVVAVICGTIAQLTSGYTQGGWLVNLILGFLGALAGVFISRLLDAKVLYNLPIGGSDFPVIYAMIGAVIFLAIISFFIKPGMR